jgi:hypothetical protein
VPKKKNGNKVQSSTHHSFHKKLHISIEDASETPKTSRKSNVSLAKAPVSSTKLANEREQEKQKRNPTKMVPQNNQNLFEELEEISEDMEAMLDEVYKNEHKTPAMMKTCALVKKSMLKRKRKY